MLTKKSEDTAQKCLLMLFMLLTCFNAMAQQNIVAADDGTQSLSPTVEAPAFGAVIDYSVFPQLTNLPTMYITVYKTTYDETTGKTTYDDTQTMDISTTKTDWYYQCRIVIADMNGKMKQRDELVQLRGRGNSTWTWVNSGKRPFRLKFPAKTKLLADYDLTTGQEVNEFANEKNWTLLANAFDKTLIHNAITYEIAHNKLTNLAFCPSYRFVDLVINGVKYGTYQISDHVQVASDRVNVDSDTGWFMEFTGGTGDAYLEEPYFVVNNNLYVNIKNPETSDDDYAAMKTYVTNLYNDVINTYTSSDIPFSDYIDANSFIDWMIGEEISGNYDGTKGNMYNYMESTDDKLHFGPMWDFDIAYGAYGSMLNDHLWGSSTDHSWQGTSRMCSKLYNDAKFFKAFYARWQQVYDDGNLKTFISNKVDELANTLNNGDYTTENANSSQYLNFNVATPFGAGPTSISTADNMGGSFSSYAAAVNATKTFISDHIDWLNTEYTTQYTTLGCADIQDESTEEAGSECTEHTYTAGNYTKQDDGTYRRACDNCAGAETDGETFYLFTVYPESKESTAVYATSWEPDAATPNAIATVDVATAIADNISGYNIVSKTGKTCKSLVITDGHPFYNPLKFTATAATYSRSLSNDWGTICLPYKVQNVSTDDVTFYQLSSVAENYGTLVFETATSSGAYTPLAFRYTGTGASKSITVDAADVTVKASSEDKTKSFVTNWTMVGTTEKTLVKEKGVDIDGKTIYYIANNAFYYVPTSSSYTSNPFRAYFEFASSSSETSAKQFSIALAGFDYQDTATWIKTADADSVTAVFAKPNGMSIYSPSDASISVYSVSGGVIATVNIAAGSMADVALPAGTYIVNGAKVCVK